MEIIISVHGANGSRSYSINHGTEKPIFRGSLKELTAFMIKNYPQESLLLARAVDPRLLPSFIRFGSIEPSEKFDFLESLSSHMLKK